MIDSPVVVDVPIDYGENPRPTDRLGDLAGKLQARWWGRRADTGGMGGDALARTAYLTPVTPPSARAWAQGFGGDLAPFGTKANAEWEGRWIARRRIERPPPWPSQPGRQALVFPGRVEGRLPPAGFVFGAHGVPSRGSSQRSTP